MISVCIATYNGEKYIKEQLESIMPQLSEDDEIIISDDGSTDNTISVIKGINDKRIQLYFNGNPSGVVENVQNCLEKAKGETVFLCDQDDVWLPVKVTKMTEALKSSDLVISDCYVTDENLNILHKSFYKINNAKTDKWSAVLKNPYLGCCMAFNRNVLGKSLPIPKKTGMHDIWIGNVAAFYYKVVFLNDKLIYYRRHGNNTSTASDISKNNMLKKINLRIVLLYQLYKIKKR